MMLLGLECYILFSFYDYYSESISVLYLRKYKFCLVSYNCECSDNQLAEHYLLAINIEQGLAGSETYFATIVFFASALRPC